MLRWYRPHGSRCEHANRVVLAYGARLIWVDNCSCGRAWHPPGQRSEFDTKLFDDRGVAIKHLARFLGKRHRIDIDLRLKPVIEQLLL
jgi:hypothetical protein